MSKEDVKTDDDAVRGAASDWFVKLSSETSTDADWSDFHAWLEDSPRHRAAFDAMECLWIELEALRPDAEQPSERTVAPVARGSVTRASWTPAALAASLVIAAGVGWSMWWSGGQEAVETGMGQRASIALAIGGKAELSPSSRLVLRRKGAGEEARLVRGEARFTVAHDPNRRFIVKSGDFTVTDVGTVFQVSALGNGVKVSVEQGEVSVARPSQPLAALVAGQTYVAEGAAPPQILSEGPAIPVKRPDSLVFEAQPLSVVAADIGRRFDRPISVDEDAQSLRFSGVLKLDSEGAVIHRLENFLPISADVGSRTIVLHRRAAAH
jgi:transmembrane sensor